MEKLVSVIITTHERPCNILERAVKSVVNQTYSNIEIIVVNDALDYIENSKIKEMLTNYNVLYLENKKKGACASRNLGIRNSKGEIIALLDDDDEWAETKLEELVPFLTSDIGLVYSDFDYIESDKKVTFPKKANYEGNVYKELLLDNFIGGCSIPIFKKNTIIEIGLFDEEMPSCQDIDVWLRIAKHYKIKYVSKKLVHYYVSDIAITSNPRKRIEGWEKLIAKFYKDMKKYPNCILKWQGLILENKIAFGMWSSIINDDIRYKDVFRYIKYVVRGLIKFILIKIKLRNR